MFNGRKVIYLAMPSYANHESGMMRAAYKNPIKEGEDRFLIVEQAKKGCSLLASSFNGEWCNAWNDPRIDYWCLFHGDVEPEPGWLSVLVDEFEENLLDVLHVVAPIKDERGLTSTAIGRNDNEWAMVRRITLAELYKMPETFGLQDCIESLEWPVKNPFQDLFESNYLAPLCLLPNTGLMLVRRAPWVFRFPGFTIRDRLCYYKDGHIWPPYSIDQSHDYALQELPVVADAALITQVMSEDWNFGHWLARRNIRVGGTRKIKLGHWGGYCYTNYKVWGQPTDENFTTKLSATVSPEYEASICSSTSPMTPC